MRSWALHDDPSHHAVSFDSPEAAPGCVVPIFVVIAKN
jgi:hypothetical protein